MDPTSENWMDGFKTAEAELLAELEQARKERDAAVMAGAMAHEYVKRERDRYRDALEDGNLWLRSVLAIDGISAPFAEGCRNRLKANEDALVGKGQA